MSDRDGLGPDDPDQTWIDYLAEEYPEELESLADSDLDSGLIAEEILNQAERREREE